jgi:ribosomal protein S18 acetylase RimI-like enzyme
MGVRIVGVERLSHDELLRALSRLYKSDFMQPHCYLIYDLLYEPENTDVLLKLSPDNVIESYVLTWRGPLASSVHVWGSSWRELLDGMKVELTRPVYVELYGEDEDLIERISSRLTESGFKSVEVKRFHDMVCDEEAFRPSENEHLATKLTITHAELFRRYMCSRNIDLTHLEAQKMLTKMQYYGVIVEEEIISTAATCLKLPEVHVICDVYTRPEFRGRGYAKATTSAVTRRAVESGAMAVLSVEVSNEVALKLYRELGYRVVRTRPWIIARPGGWP